MAITRTAIQQALDKLNQSTNDNLAELAQYTQAKLNTPPSEGAWTVLQNLHHLMIVEKLSCQYCIRKLSYEPDLPKTGFSTTIRDWLSDIYLDIPIKFDAPKLVNSTSFPEEDTLENVQQTWLVQREALADFLANLPAQYVDTAVYKQIFTGRISFVGMLNFFGAHQRRHWRQVQQTLKVLKQG